MTNILRLKQRKWIKISKLSQFSFKFNSMCKISTVKSHLACTFTKIMQENTLFSGKISTTASRDGRDKSQLWRALNPWVCCVLSQFLFACLLSCVCERVLVLWKLLGRCPILVPPTLFGQHCKRFWLFDTITKFHLKFLKTPEHWILDASWIENICKVENVA